MTFFSVSMGKRPVLHSADISGISLLMAVWFFQHNCNGTRQRALPAHGGIAGAAGLILIVITMGALWRHDPSWFFSPVEPRHTGSYQRREREVWTLDTHLDRLRGSDGLAEEPLGASYCSYCVRSKSCEC